MKNKKGHWEGQSMKWDEGDVPECDFCGKNANQEDLFETPFSGQLCCNNSKCLMALAEQSLEQQIEFIEDDDNETTKKQNR